MHATRIVTFLLGAWIIGTLFTDSVIYINLNLPERAISGAPPEAEKIIKDYTPEQASLLLHYFVAEANQVFLNRWEMVQVLLGLLLIPAVYVATDRKGLPLIVAAFLLILALVQFLTVAPEVAYRSREIAFPPGKGNVVFEARVSKLWYIFTATETVMVVVSGGLAAYVASYRSRRRMSERFSEREESLPLPRRS